MTRGSLYLIGSLRNPRVPVVGDRLRAVGFDVFDNWYSGGPGADDAWRDYERGRGRTYAQALKNHSAQHIYTLDRFHLNRAHGAVLVLPAGRSGHLEAGWFSATKPVFMLLDEQGEPDRLDVMTQFLHGVCRDIGELEGAVSAYPWPKVPELPFHTVADVLWLAGVFEGDGTFCTTGKMPRMVLQMTDADVVEKAAEIMGSKVWSTAKTRTGKNVYTCGVSGLTAAEWMRIVRPYMGARRQRQIVDTASRWLETRTYNVRDRQWWARAFQLEGAAQ